MEVRTRNLEGRRAQIEGRGGEGRIGVGKGEEEWAGEAHIETWEGVTLRLGERGRMQQGGGRLEIHKEVRGGGII